jgi:hypothetical protein
VDFNRENATSIRVFPRQAAIAEVDHRPQDVVPKSPPPESKPILTLAFSHVLQLLDVVYPGSIVRIRGKNVQR